jgi:hypothetical protein
MKKNKKALSESEPQDIAVFTTTFVLDDKKRITYVSRELEDGTWLFFSDDEFDDFEAVVKILGFNEIMEMDPTLKELKDMKPGYFATRKGKSEAWVIGKED